ncbi:MAG: RNA pseudouridine synthase [Burkholderiales bacterium]|nr:RNA pseudouridine synthase [Burkholderiales bacterium]
MTTTGLRLLYQDDALLVVDKPAGLLSVPGRGPNKADCAASRVQQQFPDALVVHRLDMGTSGLLLFARGPEAQRQISRSFEARQTDKRYEALVWGLVQGDQGQIDLPLICDWPNRPRQMVSRDAGKPSTTRWQVLARDASKHQTRIALQPITGRSHQLRVHLQTLGHPILGDELYAHHEALAAAPRLMLHACRLSLPHPNTGATLVLGSGVPF